MLGRGEDVSCSLPVSGLEEGTGAIRGAQSVGSPLGSAETNAFARALFVLPGEHWRDAGSN